MSRIYKAPTVNKSQWTPSTSQQTGTANNTPAPPKTSKPETNEVDAMQEDARQTKVELPKAQVNYEKEEQAEKTSEEPPAKTEGKKDWELVEERDDDDDDE
ncbi:unnamed protein product [Didymodactylos carnosus]|uniref:Uncharacterized protein n=1 Tax=Didymodactylos carnosus TaxID=1234261 RepID=A0A816EU37_9BILA|nr:unnamed protein product [Didymodactylos carnosus]CAF1650553.1 unnamed protein product [Didymodactylos carnosus]CAF3819480.1 unnamed protein product [Didymodactylos carnosus]CAF4578150.1 unnamed protein product [Didymodactylos carnosus]